MRLLDIIRLFRVRGRVSTWAGRREGRKKRFNRRGGESWRDLSEDDLALSCCVTYQVPGGGLEMKGGDSI